MVIRMNSLTSTSVRPTNVLILCTANSARSILAEAILNRLGNPDFVAFSAGSHPRGTPNPRAVELLTALEYPTAKMRSKSWDEFSTPAAPAIDLVVTVCDAAAGEACPLFSGASIKAHWGIPDPAGDATDIEAERAAFRLAYDRLFARMSALIKIPFATLNRDELQKRLDAIAQLEGATELSLQ